jgi:predicted ester cyclase
LHITTDEIIAEGDKVTRVWTANSTHKGEFMSIQATGIRITVKGIELFRTADGKIAEIWAIMDNLGMMQQLGVIPAMEG